MFPSFSDMGFTVGVDDADIYKIENTLAADILGPLGTFCAVGDLLYMIWTLTFLGSSEDMIAQPVTPGTSQLSRPLPTTQTSRFYGPTDIITTKTRITIITTTTLSQKRHYNCNKYYNLL